MHRIVARPRCFGPQKRKPGDARMTFERRGTVWGQGFCFFVFLLSSAPVPVTGARAQRTHRTTQESLRQPDALKVRLELPPSKVGTGEARSWSLAASPLPGLLRQKYSQQAESVGFIACSRWFSRNACGGVFLGRPDYCTGLGIFSSVTPLHKTGFAHELLPSGVGSAVS